MYSPERIPCILVLCNRACKSRPKFHKILISLVFIYNLFSTRLHDPSNTCEIHPIPSALGSEALAGQASTTVRENVGSPDEDCFCPFFLRIFSSLSRGAACPRRMGLPLFSFSGVSKGVLYMQRTKRRILFLISFCTTRDNEILPELVYGAHGLWSGRIRGAKSSS